MVPICSSQSSDFLCIWFFHIKAEKEQETTGFYPEARGVGADGEHQLKHQVFNKTGKLVGHTVIGSVWKGLQVEVHV